MHYQTYGFDWGFAGDTVQVVRSRTMDQLPERYVISQIEPADRPEVKGAKIFRIIHPIIITRTASCSKESPIFRLISFPDITCIYEQMFINLLVNPLS